VENGNKQREEVMKNLETIREALDEAICSHDGGLKATGCRSYYESLQILEKMEPYIIPILPEGWRLDSVRYSSINGMFGANIRHKDNKVHVLGVEGWGASPRAAVLEAMKKIPDEGDKS
jgi:hypothetical protein